MAIARSMPHGEKLFEFEFPMKTFRDIVPTSDETLLVGPGFEKLKDTLFIFNCKSGLLMHKVVLKYANFKDYLSLLPVPRKATQVINTKNRHKYFLWEHVQISSSPIF